MFKKKLFARITYFFSNSYKFSRNLKVVLPLLNTKCNIISHTNGFSNEWLFPFNKLINEGYSLYRDKVCPSSAPHARIKPWWNRQIIYLPKLEFEHLRAIQLLNKPLSTTIKFFDGIATSLNLKLWSLKFIFTKVQFFS